LVAVIPGWAQFSGTGAGTPGDPYIIETAAQLNEARNDLAAHYRLNADIDLGVAPYNTGQGWVPIGGSGSPTPPFTGTFDGNGHTVAGMYVNRIAGYVGLFGYLEAPGIVMNVGMVNVNINSIGSGGTSFNNYIGGLVGTNAGTIDNCYVTGTITAPTKNNVGGLVGNNYSGGTIKNSYSAANVTGADHVGGVAGQQNGGRMENCYAIGTVTGNSGVGGLVGWNVAPASQNFIENSAALNSSVSGSANVGRVSGNSTAALTNNVAFDGMNVIIGGSPKTIVSVAGGIDGESKDACEVVVLGGYFSDWDEFPAHIKAALPDAESQCGVVTITTDSFPGGGYLTYMQLTLTATITPANASEPMLWEVIDGGSLPVGLTLDPATGVISGIPDAAGMYAFTIRVTATRYETSDTKELSIEIAKATLMVAAPEGITATYGQALEDVDLPPGWSWNEPGTLVGGVGVREHLARYTPEDVDNYNIIENVTIHIAVNNADLPFVIPVGLTATYGQTLSDVDLSEHSNWSWMDDSAPVGGAGPQIHLAKFTPEDQENYNTAENIPVLITVNKADPVYTVPVNLVAVYGQKLSNVILPSGWLWMSMDEAELVGGAGTRTHLAMFTPIDTANYNIAVDIPLDIRVNKANPSYTAPTILSAVYGQTLANVNLAAYPGWSWMNGSTSVGSVGTRTHLARFTPADTDNYNIIENVSVQITVKKANLSPDYYEIPTGLTALVGDRLAGVDLSAYPGWSWMNDSILVGAAGSRTHLARYTPANSNYNVINNISVRIQVRAIIYVSDIIDLANPPGEDVVGNRWTFYDGVYTIEDGAHVAIVGSNEESGYRVVIAADAKNVTVELSSATITGLPDHPPLLLNAGSEVELTLVGTNVFTAEADHAGIEVPVGSTLKIGGAGSLAVTGGGNGGAGIGGGGDITISGGTVTAIGGGSGAGIGGTLAMDGVAVVFASSVDDTDETKRTSGILVTKNDDKTHWYGNNDFTLSYDVIVPVGYTLTVEDGRVLTIPAGKTLDIPDGTTLRISSATYSRVRDCGTIIVEGNLPEGLLTPGCLYDMVTDVTAVYGQTLADINSMPIDRRDRGTFSWSEDLTTSVGTVPEPVQGLYLEFTPHDAGRYYGSSTPVSITVLKAPQNAPDIAEWAAGVAGGWSTSVPGLAAAISTSEVILLLDDYEPVDASPHSPLEYCIRYPGDGMEECVENDVGDWQADPSFDSLEANTEYIIFVRYEGTENLWPSATARVIFRTLLLDAHVVTESETASEPEAAPSMQRGALNHGDEGYGISLERRIVRGKADFSVNFPEHLKWMNVVIFDNLGNVVFTRQGIRNGEQISWNLVNRSGRGVAGGTYLIVATARDRERAYRYSTLLTVGGR
jgi:hypothetical protein